jgi:hypothetical protein
MNPYIMNAFMDELGLIKEAGLPAALRKSSLYKIEFPKLLEIAENPRFYGARQTQAALVLKNRAGNLPGPYASPVGQRAKKLSGSHMGGSGTREPGMGFAKAAPTETLPGGRTRTLRRMG